MNPIAYRTTSLAIKTLSNLSKARVNLHNTENIPRGAKIFVINHFTRLETFLIPYYLHRLIRQPVWSLASSEFFVGAMGRYLESVGAVSTKAPDRDRLIIKTLLTNEAGWMIFPEGRMVKSKKIIEKGRYMISCAEGKHPPHTGAANLALRAEFYRQRLLRMHPPDSEKAQELLAKFNLASVSDISNEGTFVVPVNLTYYPLRAQVNILNRLAKRLVEDLPERVTEELMTEGAMLLAGVDIDIRFGKPIDVGSYLKARSIRRTVHYHQQGPETDDPLGNSKAVRKTVLKITQRYMGAIYSMTTVNHDHILASLLKHSPSNCMLIENWRRRAFLAITRDAPLAGVYLHSSLEENQSHLLIDDHYGKLADFLTIAEEKRVVVQGPPYLFRTRKKLSSIFDFDRVRIDNPIAVSANEVEPLTALQKKISRLSWTPGFRLRALVVGFLLKKAVQEFDDDYRRHFREGVSKDKTIGRPFLIKGRSRKIGVVLSHGYMAAPEEVRTLAECLGRHGYCVYVPRLKGHGTSPEDLAERSYQEWIHCMEEGYLIMRNLCKHVVLGGFSTGAALALELAARADGVIAVFAVSTPLRLQYTASRLAPVVDTWNRIMERVHLDDAKMEFVENRPENPHINYLRNPISGIRELERLMDHLEPRLADIRVPALVVQSQEDPVVNPKGSERIFGLIGCRDKQYLVFNFKRHGILLGEGSERVHRAIGEFIRYAATAGAPSEDGEVDGDA